MIEMKHYDFGIVAVKSGAGTCEKPTPCSNPFRVPNANLSTATKMVAVVVGLVSPISPPTPVTGHPFLPTVPMEQCTSIR